VSSLLDVYCERAAEPGVWAEPLNAVTNLTFVAAAALAWRRFAAEPGLGWRHGWDLGLLILLLAAIGIGSGLWHTLATGWAMLADVLPIALFINLFLLSFTWRVLRLTVLGVAGLWISYQLANAALVAFIPTGALNGSVGYLPALGYLLFFWLMLRARAHPMAWRLAAAVLLFAVSLTLRTLDKGLCSALPIGTHFLWHLLNAVLLYWLLAGLIGCRRRGAEPTAPEAAAAGDGA
jgi:hypothetical protein